MKFIQQLIENIVYSDTIRNCLEELKSKLSNISNTDEIKNIISSVIYDHYNDTNIIVTFKQRKGSLASLDRNQFYEPNGVSEIKIGNTIINNYTDKEYILNIDLSMLNDINEFLSVLGHELIHLEEVKKDKRNLSQYIDSISKNRNNFYNKYQDLRKNSPEEFERIKFDKYKSDPRELKAYAYSFVDNLKNKQYNRNTAFRLIARGDYEEISKIDLHAAYYLKMSKEIKNKFLQHVYAYIEKLL